MYDMPKIDNIEIRETGTTTIFSHDTQTNVCLEGK